MTLPQADDVATSNNGVIAKPSNEVANVSENNVVAKMSKNSIAQVSDVADQSLIRNSSFDNTPAASDRECYTNVEGEPDNKPRYNGDTESKASNTIDVHTQTKNARRINENERLSLQPKVFEHNSDTLHVPSNVYEEKTKNKNVQDEKPQLKNNDSSVVPKPKNVDFLLEEKIEDKNSNSLKVNAALPNVINHDSSKKTREVAIPSTSDSKQPDNQTNPLQLSKYGVPNPLQPTTTNNQCHNDKQAEANALLMTEDGKLKETKVARMKSTTSAITTVDNSKEGITSSPNARSKEHEARKTAAKNYALSKPDVSLEERKLAQLLKKYEDKKFTPLKRRTSRSKPKNPFLILAQSFLNKENDYLSNSIKDFGNKDLSTINAVPLLQFRDMTKFKDRASNEYGILGDCERRRSFASEEINELEKVVLKNFMDFRGDEKTKKLDFAPFSLEYNESSIAAISTWASKDDISNDKEEQKNGRKSKESRTGNIYPTVPVLFRKCQLCNKYGHYEIECTRMTEENAIELAEKVKTYSILKEFDTKQRQKEEISFRHIGYDKSGNEFTAVDDAEEDFYRKSLLCEVCCSGLDADHMLICDGCDKLFHLYCLTPPLKKVPKGDWFCESCKNYNLDVSSDVEIEVCMDFVIEQRKRPREEMTEGEDPLGLHWQAATAVVQEGFKVNPSKVDLEPAKRRLVHIPGEQTVLDGFAISASATSLSPKVVARLESCSALLKRDIATESLAVGCIVAWFLSQRNDGGESRELSPLVGIVLAVDAKSGQALVREVDEWKDILLEEQGSSRKVESLEECTIRAVSSGATFWYPVGELHVVARAPPKMLAHRFHDVVPPRVAATQQINLKAPTQIYLKRNEDI